MNWFVAFGKRLVSATPTFFKKIIYFGILLGAIGAGLIAAKSQLPLWIVDMGDNFIIVGIVAGVVAGASVKHPEAL